MLNKLAVRSFAKINLQLRIAGARPDGFHEIYTVFQSIDLHDTLHLRAGGAELVFSCDSQETPIGEDNLVVQAARGFAARLGGNVGVRVHLEKRIPIAAGLGGGSSNAAAALKALDLMYGQTLLQNELEGIAEVLGSDVPYFLVGGTAIGRGRGEVLTPVADVPVTDLLVVKPRKKISAAEAYELFDLTCGPTISDISMDSWPGDDCSPESPWRNDLERGVFETYPEVGGLKDRLLASGAAEAVMCGSGSALVGRFSDREAALRAAERLQTDGIAVFHCSTLARSQYMGSFLCEE